ncbi:hypothetical protein Tco_0027542, partial [Tanacetum coccineum]
GLSVLAIVAAFASRAVAIPSATSFDINGDEDPTDEDGDIGMGDSTGVSASLGGEIFSGGKKCWEIVEAFDSLVSLDEHFATFQTLVIVITLEMEAK